jgi:chromosome segregation ATPase
MGIRYPKEFVKPDGRKLVSGGPRDLQRRQQISQVPTPDIETVDSLKKQIEEIKEISKRLPKQENYFSPEEVDEEIRKAVENAVKETTISLKRSSQGNNQEIELALQKYKSQIVELQKSNDDFIRIHKTIIEENKELKDKIEKLKQNENIINELKTQIAVLEQTVSGKEELIVSLKTRPMAVIEEIEDPKRPKMDKIFIDPIENGAGEKLKANIRIEQTLPVSEREEVEDKVGRLKSLMGKLPTKKH